MKQLLIVFALMVSVFVGATALRGSGPPESASARGHVSPAAGMAAEPGRRGGRSVLMRLARLGIAVALAAVLLGVMVALLENRFIYYPTRGPVGGWEPAGIEVEQCAFQTTDGLTLHAWWYEDKAALASPVLLWFHGNAGNLTHRAENLRMLAGRGLDVFLFDYRGFGKSQGHPSESGLYLDAEAAYTYLVQRRGIAPGRIVCFGRSLGAAVALYVSLRQQTAGLIMESPFESAQAMARKMLPVLPLWLVVRSRFDNVGRIANLTVPLLVVHGGTDKLVPMRQARAVFEAAPEPKSFYTVEGAGHNDTYLVGGARYIERLVAFCEECVRGR